LINAELATQVKNALFGQKYNLLLGAGVSLDATDRRGKPVLGAEDLRKRLCEITGSRESSPLWRVAGLLTPEQVKAELTQPYFGCQAGKTLLALSRFAWKTAFTLNIDDALENAYQQGSVLQSLLPINYTREFETFRNPQELPLIHLHGTVRLPDEKYVFSLQEYGCMQRNLNPWVHLLSNLIVTEPFIIAGTALFEPDLEYFIAHRPSNARVISRAPSILVEPYPDAGTRKDCERLNLVLVEAKLEDFLSWLLEEFGDPPSPLALRQPLSRPRVTSASSKFSSAAFWSDFDFIAAPDLTSLTATQSPQNVPAPTGFVFGRPPSWDDIQSRKDVPLQEQLAIIDEIRRWQGSGEPSQIVSVIGKAGSGKSTTIRRIAADLVTHGLQVFYLKAPAGFDVESAAEFFGTVVDPIVLVTDSMAEHGDQIVNLISSLGNMKRICILGTERQYRMRVVKEILADMPVKSFEVTRWRDEERVELIRRYSAMGVVGTAEAVANPRKFAGMIAENVVAEAVCRILNDFRPMRAIARSLWNDTGLESRSVFIAVALAYYCHPVGVRQDVICDLYGQQLVDELSLTDAPLKVSTNPDESDYLIPSNAMLGSLILEELASQKPGRLLQIAVELANGLAPFVTRRTIQQRTPEARLAGRLFDADGLMPNLLKEKFNDFFEMTNEHWKWNSRYWEQLALWMSNKDRAVAIQHARHAVAIERHPFPMTTLAKVLFSSINNSIPLKTDYFNEALNLMEETLQIEASWERGKTRTAYGAVIDGVQSYQQAGGILTPEQSIFVEKTLREVLYSFPLETDTHRRSENLMKLLENRSE